MTMPAQKPGQSKQDYGTPLAFLEAVKRRLGIREFSIDLAANENGSNAKAPRWLYDALPMPWALWTSHGPSNTWGWLNPPFSDIEPWAAKCAETKCAGGQVALLVPASVGSNWFRDHVDGQAFVLLLNGRLAFMPDKPTWLYPKDCILALYSQALTPGYEVWDWRATLKAAA
jgi:phage N-6-adenine-methyltransferase